jgi:S-formylglutathione hydrolase
MANRKRYAFAAYGLLFAVCVLATPSLAQGQQTELVEFSLETELVPGPVMVGALLPPGHSSVADPLPLLLLLHGGGGSYRHLGAMQQMIEQAWSSGDLPELVVVMPSAGRSFYVDYRDGSQLWESFLMREFLPLVRKRFNVVQGRNGTAVSGLSMGGMGSLRLAFKYPDTFQAVAAMAPGIEPALSFDEIAPADRSYRSDEVYEERFGRPVDRAYWQQNHPISIADVNIDLLKESGLQVYIEVGNEDQYGLFRGAELLHRILYDGGIKHEYRVVHGAGHAGRYAERFLNSLQFLGRILGSSRVDQGS